MTDQQKTRDSRMLEVFLDPDFEQRRIWHPQELGAMLEHQWKAMLKADLGGVSPQQARILRELCDAQGLSLKSYGDIFTHRLPPVELLELIKDYAKRNMARPDKELPEGIASLLYVLSVVVARVRCGKRITSQGDEAVRKNIEAVLAQSWVTPPVAEILREGLKVFGEQSEASEEDNAPRPG